MKFNISGNHFCGGSSIFGIAIGNESANVEPIINPNGKILDQEKRVFANGINRIYVHSNCCNIELFASGKDEITAKLSGTIISGLDDDAIVDIRFEKNGNEVNIAVNLAVSRMLVTNEMQLSVSIPKRCFQEILVLNQDANIRIASSVSARTIKAQNINGNIDVLAIFTSLTACNKNGDIIIDSVAHSDTALNVFALNGNTKVALKNVGIFAANAEARNGLCSINPEFSGPYIISGNIISENGNVFLQ